jgi:aryl-alcohol dehydrogenase-like predicted oxidoreductase
MRTRPLGLGGPPVSAVGPGCMGLSGGYGPAGDAEGIATIQAALDAGINRFDTGDFHGMGHSEMLLGDALRGRRQQAFVAVRFGAQLESAIPAGAVAGERYPAQAMASLDGQRD